MAYRWQIGTPLPVGGLLGRRSAGVGTTLAAPGATSQRNPTASYVTALSRTPSRRAREVPSQRTPLALRPRPVVADDDDRGSKGGDRCCEEADGKKGQP